MLHMPHPLRHARAAVASAPAVSALCLGLLLSSPLPDGSGSVAFGQAPASAVSSPAPLRALQGVIGKDLRIRMFLRPGPGPVEGFYFYEKYGVPILLKGSVAPDGRLKVDELDGKGRVSAHFDVALGENGLEGSWSAAKGNRTLPVKAAPNKPFPRDVPSLSGGFSGTLGARIHFRAQLNGETGKLQGFYRYPKSTEDLQLTGTLSADGAFSLEERSGKGDVTGRWRGYFLTPSLAAGDWSNADGTKRLPLMLKEGGPLEKIVDLGGGMKLIPNNATYQGKLCDIDLSWPQLSGHPNAAAQDLLNRSWALSKPSAKDCMKPEPDQTWEYYQSSGFSVTAARAGFLGLSFGSAEYTGGAHGNWGSVCKVYQLSSATEVELAKKLKPDGLARLSALVDRNFKKENGVTDLAEAGFFQSTIELTSMPSICLQQDGFTVLFTPYEISPYVMGAPETAITAAEAASLFVSDAQTKALFGQAQTK